MIGTKLAQYEIIEELGQGGMATVYRAYQPRMDRFVAVKVIRQSIVEESTVRERFQREARVIARLEHPHLLPVHDFDGAHKPPYIVMRYLEGGTLKKALASRRLPFDEITYLLRQVGSALDYAHRQGVIHRDIKPSNIMIDKEGNAFVMDFGIARMTGRDSADGGLTGTGTIIGTPDYMAPEQGFGSAEVDLRADIYSQGVMLFEMTTGQLPFRGKTPMETMLHHLSNPVPSAHRINPELPEELDKVISMAMAKEPADRYPSVVEFTADVVGVMGVEVTSTPITLQQAAQESVALTGRRLAQNKERIEVTMAEFAADRREVVSGVDSQSTPAQQHRTVTALYADAAEYNELVELEDGPELAQRAVRDLWSQAAKIVEDYGGAVFSQSDRDLLALWGAVSAHEDDPERAVLTALAVRDSMGTIVETLIPGDDPIPIRIALNTGPALIDVDTESGSYSASGATVNLANRVAHNADGLVLITQGTYRHIQGIFDIEEERPLRIRRAGSIAMVNTYRVNEAKPRAFRLQPRGVEGVDTQMIGRRAELEEIQKAYYAAVEDSETQAVTVVSAAGMGKSRLLYEFAAWTELRPEKFFIFRGRATPSMTNRPYSLWRDILSFRFEILDSDRPDLVQQKIVHGVSDLVGHDEKLAHLMGYLAGFDFGDSPYLVGEPKDVARQSRRAAIDFFQKLTESNPVVIQLEDLHHADNPSLDLLVDMISDDEDRPLFLLSLARPLLFQRRPSWGGGQYFHSRIDLKPLSKRDSRELAAEILQKVEELPRELRDLLVERAEGNPYYMEELVKMLVEDRVILKVDDNRWIIETSRLRGLRVPPTLVSLLQARFDSLLYPEKLTLQRAAVVGRVFYDSAVVALDAADHTHIDDLSGIFKSLTQREFIFPRESSAFEGSTEYIFGQAMMRDLILETILENQTKTYHKAMAQWLSVQSGQREGEYDGLIADHYERASEYFLAAEYLAKAGPAAYDLGAYHEGLNLSEKALELLDKTDQRSDGVKLQLKVQLSLADAYAFQGDYDRTQTLLEGALEGAQSLGDRAAEASALAQLGRLTGSYLDDFDKGLSYLERALEINQELDDKSGLVFILRQLGNISNVSGQNEQSVDYLMESVELAREIEDYKSIGIGLNSLGLSVHSFGDLDGALAHYEEGLEFTRQVGDDISSAMIIQNIGFIYTVNGEYERALKMADEALEALEEADNRYLLDANWRIRAWVALGTGDFERALIYIRKSIRISQELGTDSSLVLNLCLYAWREVEVGSRYRALEWLGLCQTYQFHHQVTLMGLPKKVLAKARSGVSDADVEAALARGVKLSLDAVINEILGNDDQS